MKSTQDGRNRTAEQQEIIRQQAVKAVLGGMKQVEAAHVFGVSRVAIFKWLKQVKKKGIQSLDAKKRGGGKEALLKPYQERWIIEKIKDKHPEQLKLELDYVLWTREAIQKLIEKRFKTRIALRTITDYLNKWKMTPQKPVAKAYQQNSQAVEEWKNTEYPAIAKRAKKEKGVIFWGDEMGLRSDHVVGRGFSPKGKKPILIKTGNRFSCNMISAISNLGKLYFSVFQGSFVISVYLDFLQRLVKQNKGRKVFLIVDGHPVHKAKAIQQWLEKNKDSIETFIIPGYSPELNPDELLNQEIKSTVFKRKRPRDRRELKAMLSAKLYSLQKQAHKIKSYFKAKHTLYATA